MSSLEIPLDLETAFSLDQGFGQFELRDYDYVNQQGTYFSRGTLNATHLIVSRYGDVAAVPLPAALPLLLSGFAGLGILARRRGRTKTAV